MATKKVKPVVEEVKEEIVTPVVEEVKKYLIVTADKLNVRKSASIESDVMEVVSKNDKLLLTSDKVTKGFYSIETPAGVKGYVMKDFVVEE